MRQNCREKTAEINLHLAVLSATRAKRGMHDPLPQEAIADYCGCSRQRIEQIEMQALKKLRRAFSSYCKAEGIAPRELLALLANASG